MRFPRCTASAGDRGSGRTVCLGIVATTRKRFGVGCAGVGFARSWRGVARGTGAASAVVVERTFAWLNQFRRLRVRYDKRADIHKAFLSLGCALICWRSLRKIWMTG